MQHSLLIAHNDENYCDELVGLFKANSTFHSIYTAKSGNDVVERIKNCSPDGLLIHAQLPDKDGVEVLSILKDINIEMPKVFFTSAIFDDELILHLDDYNIDFFIAQPISPAKLMWRVTELFVAEPSIGLMRDAYKKKADFAASVLLLSLGIPANMKGFKYIRSAVEAINSAGPVPLSGGIYKEVALLYNTTPACVERCIRHAIEHAWLKGDIDLQHELFGYTVSDARGKPTNSELICMIADVVKRKVFYEQTISA